MKNQYLLFILFAILMQSNHASATKTTVNTLVSLTSSYAAARPGDTIVVANGTYNWGQIMLSNINNTSTGAWIVVMAETRSGVVFRDSTFIRFSGTRIHLTGFKFANGSCSTNAVVAFRSSTSVFANYSRVSHITFDHYNSIDSVENEWVGIFGTNNRVDHCSFLDKSNARATVVVWYSTATFPDRSVSTFHRIDSNYFMGRSYMGGNGGETIRIGVGNNSRTFGYNVIEYNLFEGLIQTEPEIVSNKSYYNTYRYNTFKNCNGGLTLRMGKYCSVYGNFFINDDPTKTTSYGVRIIDKGHKVYNNYFEGLLGATGSLTSIRFPIITYNGTYPSSDSLNPLVLNGAYLPADSALIANNTIVNCAGGAGVKIGNYDAGMALNQALGTTLANNVIKMSSGQAVYIDSTNTALTYFAEGNRYSAPSGLGLTNAAGFTNTPLAFGSRSNGILSAPSVVQDASVNTNNYIAIIGNLDAQGQTRTSIFDAGCDEINGTGMVSNFPLDSNAVGAGRPIVVLRTQTISFAAIPSKAANAADFNAGATASSGLAVSYASSNPAVATIVNNNVHIVGYGSTVITASQSGNTVFSAATAVTQTLTVTGLSQTIGFAAIPSKVVNATPDFNPGATATSGLAVVYTSSNTAVATIVNNNIHVVGYGTSTITATQSGNSIYYAAPSVTQTLTVTGLSQTITFPTLVAKLVGNADFAGGATASSGLAITYTSSNTAVATIVNGNIHLVGAGVATITAAQPGNATYLPAASKTQNLSVSNVYSYSPSNITVTSGTLASGVVGNLATNNASYVVFNSTTTGTRNVDWYGSVFITQSPSTVNNLTINYDGKLSASKTQIIYLYNWLTSAWVQINSRSVSTTDVLINSIQTSPAKHISSTGEIRLRVYSSGGTANYTCAGDWMQFQIESTSAAKGQVSIADNQASKEMLELFPNPSTQFANLHYFLPIVSRVSISLFDVQGKKVRTIINNELQPSGDKTVQIDNKALPKGLYFIKALINNKIVTTKMIVN